MKYPKVLFFRHDQYAAIDTFLSVNEDKLECTVEITSNPKDVLKMFDCNYHILATYGKTEEEYYGSMGAVVNRMRMRWIHVKEVSIPDFNRGVNYCYIHNVVMPHERTRPVFSVFTTCYNSFAKFFRPYGSLNRQTMKDWEWVVLDDSPDEAHFKFLRETVFDDPRIRLYSRDRNSGNIGNVKNEAASLCRGKYVLELDHDDEILPDCLADAVKAFESDPDVGFVYMDAALLYENRTNHTYGDHFGLGYCGYYRQKHQGSWVNVISSPNINNISLSHIVGLPNHPRIWKRSVLNEIGNYCEYLPICDDQELILRTAVKTKMARVHKLAYIQYMNDGWNNFSLIRNSEINRLGPQFISPQAYEAYKIDEHMKSLGAYEVPGPNPWAQMWTKENFKYVYCNSVLNFDHTKQICVLGHQTLINHIGDLRDAKEDIFVLDAELSTDELCALLDQLKLDRAKCYALPGYTEETLRRYFLLVCLSTRDYEFIGSDGRTARTSAPQPELQPESRLECTFDVAFDQSPESPAPV